MIWVLVPAAYLLGTFPSAIVVARNKGVDITAVGSGNPGASNIARILGTRWGVVVFVLDGLKGVIPAATGVAAGSRPATYALVAAAVLGHMYPAMRRFQGGKGVATMAGAMAVLHPVVFAALAVVWFAVRSITKKASLGSIAIAIGLPVGVGLSGRSGWEVVASVALAGLVLLRHSDNIRRLRDGDEPSALSP